MRKKNNSAVSIKNSFHSEYLPNIIDTCKNKFWKCQHFSLTKVYSIQIYKLKIA